MQMNGGAVLRFNSRHHDVFANVARLRDQSLHQRAANAFALMTGVNIYRVLNGMTEAIKCAPVTE